jgi:hypothetical protein
VAGMPRVGADTVRIIVKLRPVKYDELFRHVCRVGTTMSAFYARARQGLLGKSDRFRSTELCRPRSQQ